MEEKEEEEMDTKKMWNKNTDWNNTQIQIYEKIISSLTNRTEFAGNLLYDKYVLNLNA